MQLRRQRPHDEAEHCWGGHAEHQRKAVQRKQLGEGTGIDHCAARVKSIEPEHHTNRGCHHEPEGRGDQQRGSDGCVVDRRQPAGDPLYG